MGFGRASAGLGVCALLVFAIPSTAGAQCDSGDTKVQDGCATVTDVGCCNDQDHLRYCAGGVLCQKYCRTDYCEWMTSEYACSGSATFKNTKDPTLTYPRACACIPDCSGKVCGDDGCGGTCGSCNTDQQCVSGQCQCKPQCDGKECGDDGCGSTCGTCTATYQWECRVGQCICTPDCTNRQCGSDGCSAQCGTCPNGQICSGTRCIDKPCTPVCFARVCGDDKCGKLCGTCTNGDYCDEFSGQCVTGECTPNCSGKACGDNGCGDLCGSCTGTTTCDPDTFQCVEGGCVPDCAGKDCGDDGCGTPCGSCGANQTCEILTGQCVASACTRQCTGKVCGDDGCDGVCGTCPPPSTCNTATGGCVEPCEPLCGTRQCGDNGCGGSCGDCGDGLYCDDKYRCRAGTPPDLGPADEGTPDVPTADRPGVSDTASGTDLATPDAGGCPLGTYAYYGQCVPKEAGKPAKGGGCSTAPAPAGALPLSVLLCSLATLLLALRRRSPDA